MPATLKILHTSDLHLDGRFVGITDPAARARRRREHIDVVRRIVDLALREEVDLLLICGDLFDESTFQFETIFHVIEQLKRLHRRRVLIAPGLSDAYHSGSPYAVLEWGDHVHIFDEPHFSPVILEDLEATVYGIAPDRERIEENPLEGFIGAGRAGWEILMLHGSDVDQCPDGIETPFPFGEPDRRATAAHYLALGGYHGFQTFGKKPVACYPGMPEATGFDELDDKHVALVTLDGDGVTVEKRSVAEADFREVAVDISDLGTFESVVSATEVVLRSQDLTGALIRVCLVGRPAAGLRFQVGDIAQAIEAPAGHVEILDSTRSEPQWHAFQKDSSFLGEWVRTMKKKVDSKESARHEKVRDYGLEALSREADLKLRKSGSS